MQDGNKSFIRSILWLSFFITILISWVYVFQMSSSMKLDWFGNMKMGSMTDGGMKMGSMADGSMKMGSMATLKMLFPMWSIMMIAMMLPAMVPTLRTYQDLIKTAEGSWLGWSGVLVGYIVIWIGFSLLISQLQVSLTSVDFLNSAGVIQSDWVISLALIAVGVFQFTVLKDFCHEVCHSPFGYFMSNWRSGLLGGFRMGIGLGIFCVGCCWGFMLLAFVMGYMNFIWMGLITLIVVLEKLPQIGIIIKKPLGGILILLGICSAVINLT